MVNPKDGMKCVYLPLLLNLAHSAVFLGLVGQHVTVAQLRKHFGHIIQKTSSEIQFPHGPNAGIIKRLQEPTTIAT